ncbi:MAG: helix-turn-helix domain-containing protein [Bacteroidota bacterium]|nr:helix-turn-helix domain-containing protein [Bacteroidota bacterium]
MAKIRHHHLSEGERHQIYALREQGLSIRAIAKQLERSASTISRELRRNKRSDGAYDPEEASRMGLRCRVQRHSVQTRYFQTYGPQASVRCYGRAGAQIRRRAGSARRRRGSPYRPVAFIS